MTNTQNASLARFTPSGEHSECILSHQFGFGIKDRVVYILPLRAYTQDDQVIMIRAVCHRRNIAWGNFIFDFIDTHLSQEEFGVLDYQIRKAVLAETSLDEVQKYMSFMVIDNEDIPNDSPEIDTGLLLDVLDVIRQEEKMVFEWSATIAVNTDDFDAT